MLSHFNENLHCDLGTIFIPLSPVRRNIGDFVRSFESLRRQHSVASMAGWVLAYHMGAALTHRVFANAQDPLSRVLSLAVI